ncbi:hypothetical protein C3659_11870 [Salmonella enterica]|nr:hypothetical protein [Salmonella enterica]EGW4709391.1 hypothetical protein [Salmonella enterica]
MHGFACKSPYFLSHATPVPARPESVYAPALKAPREAGRRGGESIARCGCITKSFDVVNMRKILVSETRG